MYCGLQNDDGTHYAFIPCEECMMRVINDFDKCHYWFKSVEAFMAHKLIFGKDYDEDKHSALTGGKK